MFTDMSAASPPALAPQSAVPRRQLTLFDSTCIIVGIIIGAGIYESTPLIAQYSAEPGWFLGVWIFGGFLSLIGALCYAELATTYPEEGGDYIYLTQAFGRQMGFVFAWSQLWIVRPGSIGAMAYVFARYAQKLWPLGDTPYALMIYAIGSIVVLTGINLLGVREGKWTQNLLTSVKVLGLAAVCLVGFWLSGLEKPPPRIATGESDLRLALIFVLYVYGGWNEMAYVGAEVRRPEKNILRALLLGTFTVTIIYVLVSLAFVHALGFQAVQSSSTVAADLLEKAFGNFGSRAISLLICITALGAINGMIFTGARIAYAFGREHPGFGWLGRWSSRRDAPIWSLVAQTMVTLVLVAGFGLTANGFESMVKFTTPVFWFFFLMVGISLFALRRREPNKPRPFRVPWYPLTPILFYLSSLLMLYASLSYAVEKRSNEALWSIGILILGVLWSLFERKTEPGA
jgi:APA family basic amino acid/polyamine antiporter